MSIDELRKSFNAILYERTTSPFYGTFIFSWLVWNWRIPYLTLFVDEEMLKPLTRIQYIEAHYIDWCTTLIFPFVSTLLLIGALPILSNKLYEIALNFEDARIKKKQEKEKDRLITKAQYSRMISEMNDLEQKYDSSITIKTREIEQLNTKIASLNEKVFSHNELRIILAKYGLPGSSNKMLDVTDTLSRSFQIGTQFQLTNNNLGIGKQLQDPAPGKGKVIQVVYEFERKVIEFWANENDYLFYNRDSILYQTSPFNKKGIVGVV